MRKFKLRKIIPVVLSAALALNPVGGFLPNSSRAEAAETDKIVTEIKPEDSGYFWHGNITLDESNSQPTMSTTSTNIEEACLTGWGWAPMFPVDVTGMTKPTLKLLYSDNVSFKIHKQYSLDEQKTLDDPEPDSVYYIENNTYDLSEIANADEDKKLFIQVNCVATDLYVYDDANYVSSVTNNNETITIASGEEKEITVGSYACEGTPSNIPVEISTPEDFSPASLTNLIAENGEIKAKIKTTQVAFDENITLSGKISGVSFGINVLVKADTAFQLPSPPSGQTTEIFDAKDSGYFWHGNITLDENNNNQPTMSTTSTNIEEACLTGWGWSPMFPVNVTGMTKPTLNLLYSDNVNFKIHKQYDFDEQKTLDNPEPDSVYYIENNTYDLSEIANADEDKKLFIEIKCVATDLYVYDAANQLKSVTNNNELLDVEGGKTASFEVGSYDYDGSVDVPAKIKTTGPVNDASLTAENGKLTLSVTTDSVASDTRVNLPAKVAGTDFIVYLNVKASSTSPDGTPGPDDTSAPDDTSKPDNTPGPDDTSAPDDTSKPDNTPGPDDTSAPDDTSKPDNTPGPDDTSAPDDTSKPDNTPGPDDNPGGDVSESKLVEIQTSANADTKIKAVLIPETTADKDYNKATISLECADDTQFNEYCKLVIVVTVNGEEKIFTKDGIGGWENGWKGSYSIDEGLSIKAGDTYKVEAYTDSWEAHTQGYVFKAGAELSYNEPEDNPSVDKNTGKVYYSDPSDIKLATIMADSVALKEFNSLNIQVQCASDTSFNPWTSINFIVTINGTKHEIEVKGDDESYTNGALRSCILDGFGNVKKDDNISISAYTASWKDAADYVFQLSIEDVDSFVKVPDTPVQTSTPRPPVAYIPVITTGTSAPQETTAPEATPSAPAPTDAPTPAVSSVPTVAPSYTPADATDAPGTSPSGTPEAPGSTETPTGSNNENTGQTGGNDDYGNVTVPVKNVKADGVNYVVTNNSQNTVEYTNKTKNTASVKVPSTIKVKVNGKNVTYKVTSIAPNAFKNNTKVKTITVGKNIVKIGKNAFKGCQNIKTIKITSKKLTSKNVAKNAFKGVGNKKKVVIKVPKSKYKDYKKMLKNKGLGKKAVIKKY